MRFTKRLTALATATIVMAVFSMTACNRKSSTDVTEDTGYGADHVTLEKSYDDAQSVSDEAATTGTLSIARSANATVLGSCATITNDTTASPHVLTIDFGTTNCLGKDGNYRRGQIVVTYTGHYKDAGSSHTIAFNNYFFNDNQLAGTKTVQNMGNNSSGQPYYNVTVNGQVILANNAGTLSWTSTRTRTWIAGYNTQDWTDDVYQISGNATVTRVSGKTFTITITTPLQVALNCKWIESGVVQITPDGSTARTLDYGNGTCDAEATYTVGSKVYNISLNR